MNEPTIQLDVRPEVEAFVEDVRRHLADLPAEDRDDLTEGLAADLSDLVAEQGPSVLGDPAAYAAELRAAAGLTPGGAPARRGLLDAVRDAGSGLAARPELRSTVDFLAALRPVWWVARALAAYLLLAGFFGAFPLLGWVLAVALVVWSVQVGRGRAWPGTTKSARMVVVAANVFALMSVPVVLALQGSSSDDPAEPTLVYPGALSVGGTPVTNIYPYDRNGRPLVGVQLFDQDGRELQVDFSAAHELSGGTMPFPWYLAAKGRYRELFNVFPLAERSQPDDYEPLPREWSSDRPPRLLAPPLVRVPAVAIPPIVAAEKAAAKEAAQKAAAKEAARKKAAQAKRDR